MQEAKPIICDEQKLQNTIHKTVEEVFDHRFNERFNDAISAVTSKVIWNWKTLSVLAAIAGSIFGAYYQIQENSAFIQDGGRYTQEEADVDNANAAAERANIRKEIETAIKNQNEKLDIIINQTR